MRFTTNPVGSTSKRSEASIDWTTIDGCKELDKIALLLFRMGADDLRVSGEGADLRAEFFVLLSSCGISKEFTHLNLSVSSLQINPEGHQWWRSAQHVAFGTGAHPNWPLLWISGCLIKNEMIRNHKRSADCSFARQCDKSFFSTPSNLTARLIDWTAHLVDSRTLDAMLRCGLEAEK